MTSRLKSALLLKVEYEPNEYVTEDKHGACHKENENSGRDLVNNGITLFLFLVLELYDFLFGKTCVFIFVLLKERFDFIKERIDFRLHCRVLLFASSIMHNFTYNNYILSHIFSQVNMIFKEKNIFLKENLKKWGKRDKINAKK